MNTTKYLQTDSRWSQLPYPKKPCRLGVCGCGELAINNIIIEMEQYKNYTPHTINDYCKQFAEARCNGTYENKIPTMMKHYGLTEVKEHANMDSLWKELAKGDRVAIYLMGSRPGGSKKVHWTSSGHFISSVGYRYKDNDHQVYIKDSASDSANRNGWLGYKTHLKGDVSRVWSGKLNGTPTPTPTPPTPPQPVGKLTVDGIGGTQTVKRMQEFFGTPVDGYIGGQLTKFKTLYPALTAVNFGKGGSQCVIKLQKWLGLSDPDGIIGKNTTKAWQNKLRDLGYLAKNESIDSIIGVKSMKAWQECLNNDGKPKGNPSPSPTPTPTTKKYKTIDASDWQKNIDWKKVKADGVVCAIIRYADGNTLDSKFDKNMKEAKAQGIHIGAYIYSRAKNKAEAENEATRLFNACKPYNCDMPLYIDLEAKGLEKVANTVANAFLDKIKALGGYGGVYANLNWWNNHLTKVNPPARWVAQYYSKCEYKGDVGMWQYSSSGSVKGISTRVDMDWCYKDYWNIIPKPTPPTPKPTPTPEKQGYPGEYPNTNVKIEKREAIARKANELAYSTNTSKAKYPSGSPTASYKVALASLPKSKHNWNAQARAGASCDVFVWTVLQKAGVDGSYPSGLWKQYNYMEKNFEQIKVSEAKAGDIGFYRKDVKGQRGHIFICYSDNKTKEASFNSYYPKTIKDLKSRLSIKGKKYVKVYRPKGFITRNYLMKGDKGEEIKKLQQYMNWYDPNNKLAIDGDYGDKTYKAVCNFQEKEMGKGQGDGTVGAKTIEAMKKVKK